MFEKWKEEKRYETQTKILKQALDADGHRLDELLRLMREEGESCIYLCGGRLDNDYSFGSKDLGLAISVLPEDGEKAAEPGYHPGSTEVYVVFQGSLILELLDQGVVKTEAIGQFNVKVIPPGQCHRVRNEPDRGAASFIVKTNPHHKPGVVRCKDKEGKWTCAKYLQPDECPLLRSLLRSWEEEKRT